MQDTPGDLLQAARGPPSIRSHDNYGNVTHARASGGGVPGASRGCLRDACILYARHEEHAACRLASRREQAGRGRPVLRVTCEHLDARLPSEYAGFGGNVLAHKAGPYQYATSGWARLARAMRLAPTISLDFSRSNARDRSDLHSPNDAWTLRTPDSPQYCKIGAGGTNTASSTFRQNGVF
jgi:hypothetical protein